MDKLHYEEMLLNLNGLIQDGIIQNKKIYLFGHCNATEELADLLIEKGFTVEGILDNNVAKHGNMYRNIMIKPPQEIPAEKPEEIIVCIVARAYAAMSEQLKRIGYKGRVYKLVDYNSYAEYSLSAETIQRMKMRVERGMERLKQLEEKYTGSFRILCPFSALGDIYIMMSYLPYFLQKRGIKNCVIGVIGNACKQVVSLFGDYEVEVFRQKDMDELIQATLYVSDKNTFIPHQDRPYVVNLHKALYIKRIPLEKMYCCGVFGLPAETEPYMPTCFQEYAELNRLIKGKSVIISPYAKSVAALPSGVWEQVVADYNECGYRCFTNVTGDERALPGTQPISPLITEMKSVVEYAGTFVGIRSGMCDVLRDVNAEKIALYPEYNYCDTTWKAIDIYSLNGWKNIVVKDDFRWQRK